MNFGFFITEGKNRLHCSAKLIEIIISSDVFVHFHTENAACGTRVYLKANRTAVGLQHLRVSCNIIIYSQCKRQVLWLILIVLDPSVSPVFLFVSVYTLLSLASDQF